MYAEQTFAWQSRYKKVLNSMKRTHFHFVLHRLIKGRNRYTSLCYKENRKPLLPSAKIPKKDASSRYILFLFISMSMLTMRQTLFSLCCDIIGPYRLDAIYSNPLY